MVLYRRDHHRLHPLSGDYTKTGKHDKIKYSDMHRRAKNLQFIRKKYRRRQV